MKKQSPPASKKPRTEVVWLFGITIAALMVAGIRPHDRLTFFLETFPVILALPLLYATRRRFPLTPLLYRLVFVHALILILGGHYTYALVPLGDWMKEAFDFSRNHYDRIGHLAQGFVPAILAREILLRTSPLRPGRWLFFIVTAICLGFSAFYELIEWWTAVVGGAEADAFLATQGDVWDTQWDMFLALIGCLAAQLLLAPIHDRQLARLREKSAS